MDNNNNNNKPGNVLKREEYEILALKKSFEMETFQIAYTPIQIGKKCELLINRPANRTC